MQAERRGGHAERAHVDARAAEEADALRHVEQHVDAARAQRGADGGCVVELAAVEHGVREADGARARVDVRQEGGGRREAGRVGGRVDDADFEAERAERQPGVGVVGVLGGEDEDVVARREGEGADDVVEAFGRVAGELEGGGVSGGLRGRESCGLTAKEEGEGALM